MTSDPGQANLGPLLHFTSDDNLTSILRQGKLIPGKTPYGIWPLPESVKERHRSVCLTELPLKKAAKIAERRGQWGIALNRERLVRNGARKVVHLNQAEVALIRLRQREKAHVPGDPFWEDSPYRSPVLVDHAWVSEAEWRHPGVYSFGWDEVAYLISPDGVKLKLIPEEDLGYVYSGRTQDGEYLSLQWEDGESEPFNRVMREVLENLGEGFGTPEQVGLWRDDEDETGYGWFTPKVDVWDILDEQLPPVPDRILASILGDLGDQAHYWVRLSDLEDDE